MILSVVDSILIHLFFDASIIGDNGLKSYLIYFLNYFID